MRAASRGFSMIEVLIAVAVAAFGIAAAARFAGVAERAARRGTESGDSAQQSRLVANQLRIDLRLAGMGSTGAIGINPAVAPWNLMPIVASGGYRAVPAVVGANNIAGGAVAGWNVVPGSDAIQVVVPDPSTLQRTTVVSPAGGLIFTQFLMNCPSPVGGATSFVYVVDHGRANGAGRSQVLAITNGVGAGPILVSGGDNLMFDVAPGSDVMCARVSTYWLGQDPAPITASLIPWLHRTDLVPNTAAVPVGLGVNQVQIAPAPVVARTDLIAPGIFGMQIAYEFSSEVPTVGRAAAPAARWGFSNVVGADPSGICGNNGAGLGSCWFEARQVRVTMVVGIARAGEEWRGSAIIQEPAVEDGAPLGIPRAFARFSLTTGEVLASLRFFDKGAPASVPALPY